MEMKQSVWNLASILTYLPIPCGNKNLIMNYHSVDDHNNDFYGNISTKRFRSHLKFFSQFEIVDLPKALKDSDEKRIALTFDDGYENFYKNVAPILREFDAPATVFISPSFIGDQNYEDLVDSHGLSDPQGRIMMDSNQIADLLESNLIHIGNHTMTHADLSVVDDKKVLYDEIINSKNELEEKFGITVDRFSYPYGQKNQEALDMVSDSHTYAVGEYRDLIEGKEDYHNLPRIAGDQSTRNIRWLTSDLSHEIRGKYRSLKIPQLS